MSRKMSPERHENYTARRRQDRERSTARNAARRNKRAARAAFSA